MNLVCSICGNVINFSDYIDMLNNNLEVCHECSDEE